MRKAIACGLMLVATTASAQRLEGPESLGLPTNYRDLPLAALGKLTLDCLGTVGPTLYSASGGRLARTFDSCTQDPAALEGIDELLAAQDSVEGIIDGLGPHYALRWSNFVRRFAARGIRQCPTWTLQDVIDAPTDESVARMRKLARPGKESYRYTVSAPQCNSGPYCSVVVATACAGGFGPSFLVESDIVRGRIEVDPAWWLTRYNYFSRDRPVPNEWCNNFSGDPNVPYKLYGTLEMEGQHCCEWDAIGGKTYTDRIFQKIDCGGGFFCMTYCKEPPVP